MSELAGRPQDVLVAVAHAELLRQAVRVASRSSGLGSAQSRPPQARLHEGSGSRRAKHFAVLLP